MASKMADDSESSSAVSRVSGHLQSGLFFPVHRKLKMSMNTSLSLVSSKEKRNSGIGI
jgi:hypothetical protein